MCLALFAIRHFGPADLLVIVLIAKQRTTLKALGG